MRIEDRSLVFLAHASLVVYRILLSYSLCILQDSNSNDTMAAIEGEDSEAARLVRQMLSNHLVVGGSPSLVDNLLGLSSGNHTVTSVTLHIRSLVGWGSRSLCETRSLWEKVGKALGNLEALEEIELYWDSTQRHRPRMRQHPGFWLLLHFLRHKIKLRAGYFHTTWNECEVRLFQSILIHDNEFIKAIKQGGYIPSHLFHLIVDILATLPSLKDATLNGSTAISRHSQLSDSTMASMQILLQSRSLRSLTVHACRVTRDQCATLALNGSDSTQTCLRWSHCIIPEEAAGPNDFAEALPANTLLTRFDFLRAARTARNGTL
jgi:hypothetical protein